LKVRAREVFAHGTGQIIRNQADSHSRDSRDTSGEDIAVPVSTALDAHSARHTRPAASAVPVLGLAAPSRARGDVARGCTTGERASSHDATAQRSQERTWPHGVEAIPSVGSCERPFPRDCVSTRRSRPSERLQPVALPLPSQSGPPSRPWQPDSAREGCTQKRMPPSIHRHARGHPRPALTSTKHTHGPTVVHTPATCAARHHAHLSLVPEAGALRDRRTPDTDAVGNASAPGAPRSRRAPYAASPAREGGACVAPHTLRPRAPPSLGLSSWLVRMPSSLVMRLNSPTSSLRRNSSSLRRRVTIAVRPRSDA